MSVVVVFFFLSHTTAKKFLLCLSVLRSQSTYHMMCVYAWVAKEGENLCVCVCVFVLVEPFFWDREEEERKGGRKGERGGGANCMTIELFIGHFLPHL